MPIKSLSAKNEPSRGKNRLVAIRKDDKKPAPARPAGKQAAKPAPVSTRRSSASRTPEILPPLIDLSPERKLDILGILLAVSGLLLALGLLIADSSPLTNRLLGGFDFLLGDGIFYLPVFLIIGGGWIALRKIQRIPSLSVERSSGLILLFLFFQTFLQAVTNGGFIGSIFYNLLKNNLGEGGLWIALFAWGLIVLTMAFDLSLPELAVKFQPVMNFIGGQFTALFRRIPFLQNTGTTDPAPADDGYSPIHVQAGEAAAAIEPAVPSAVIGIPVSSPLKQIAWILPNIKNILELGRSPEVNNEAIEKRAKIIEETLISFGSPAKVVHTSRGPTITQFGVEPGFLESRAGRTRVRVSKIVSLSDDLALALAAPRIRIQAPVPGRSYVGIEVPNNEMQVVTLRDILESDSFSRGRRMLSIALGRDVSGSPVGADLASMPHLLIAGTTGSGKSVCVNAILTCLLMYNNPDEVRLVLVDPKRVELTGYNGIPHLLAPVVVEMDKVLGALQWMTREMDRRYHTFSQMGARNIVDYNTKMKAQGQKKLPYLVIVIDELADLMMIAPEETERTITRLAQLARATGIHMVLATQRPSVDVVTGLIKANFPARIAFAVSSNTDSRVILDQPGAERLLGRGDMLYQAPDAPSPVRLQGVFVSDHEIHGLVNFWRLQASGNLPDEPVEAVDGIPSNIPLKQSNFLGEDITARVEEGDVLLTEAIDLVRREGRASVSMLQRRLRIGYTRAARLVDAMEEKKIVGAPQDATGVRPVLDYGPAAPPKE